MKYLSLLGTVGCFCLIVACSSSKKQVNTSLKNGKLVLSETHPQPGDKLTVSYLNVDSTQTGNGFAPYFYVLVNDNIYGYDLLLNLNDSTWTGSLTIPDSASAIAFAFKLRNEEFDENNQKGYLQVLYNEKGDVLPGSLVSVAYAASAFYQYLGNTPNMDSVVKQMGTVLGKYPEIRPQWATIYANYLMYSDSVKGAYLANEQVERLHKLSDLSVAQYAVLINAYRLLGNQKQHDKALKKASDLYPKSDIAKQYLIQKFNTKQDIAGKKEVFHQYQQVFPINDKYKDQMLTVLGRYAINMKDYDLYQSYINQLSKLMNRANQFNNIAWSLAEKGQNLASAEAMAQQAVEYVDPTKNTYKIPYLPNSVQQNYLKRYSAMFNDTYAYILFKEGKIKKAIQQQEKALGLELSPEINTRYVQFLCADKAYDKAIESAKRFIKKGAATTALITYYKKAYVARNGSDKHFEKELKSLQQFADKGALTELKKDMTNKELPKLNLITNQGDTLTAIDFEGKITILDFWATWCGPCKASFPGMKQLVEKYKDQSDIQFLFVNTFQREKAPERKEKVMTFIKENQYPFNVVYDSNIKGNFKAAESLEIRGIPTKIIIGKDGKWKFTKVGFDGSTQNMVKEVNLMIQLLSQS